MPQTPLSPALWIIGGPNGVGKTTYAMRHIAAVSGSLEFLNQDEIARGLYPLSPTSDKALAEAGRVSVRRRAELFRRGISFSLESPLSGRSYLRTIDQAKAAGYRVCLLYFFVHQVEDSIRRVARRVESGGHNVPEETIRRRFPRSLSNFADYAARSNHWVLFDNQGANPMAVADFRDGELAILDADRLASAPEALQTAVDDLKCALEQEDHQLHVLAP
jgi:predicted ABC-type ATPase